MQICTPERDYLSKTDYLANALLHVYEAFLSSPKITLKNEKKIVYVLGEPLVGKHLFLLLYYEIWANFEYFNYQRYVRSLEQGISFGVKNGYEMPK